jgi:methionyl aminopeptidase
MIYQKSGKPKVLEDELRTAHYEHTVAVIDNKAVILTQGE